MVKVTYAINVQILIFEISLYQLSLQGLWNLSLSAQTLTRPMIFLIKF